MEESGTSVISLQRSINLSFIETLPQSRLAGTVVCTCGINLLVHETNDNCENGASLQYFIFPLHPTTLLLNVYFHMQRPKVLLSFPLQRHQNIIL